MSTEQVSRQPRKRRRRGPIPDYSGPQHVTRVPPFWSGMWVKLLGRAEVLQVVSLVGTLKPGEKYVVWRVIFENGRAIHWKDIERPATEREIPRGHKQLQLHRKQQQVTTLPPWRPEMWVKMAKGNDPEVSGRIRYIRLITATITSPEQKYAVWKIYIEGSKEGYSKEQIEREATEEEVAAYKARIK